MHLHHNEPHSRNALATGLLTVLLGASLPGLAAALPHDPETENIADEEALFIGQLNADRSSDTIYGRLTSGAHYRPTHIAWGNSQSITTAARTTEFIYPDWDLAGVSISVSSLNRDTLSDMVFYLWGRARSGEMAQTRSAALVICGSPRADTLVTIDLGRVITARENLAGSYQITTGTHLVDPAIRDYSGVESYVRLPLTLSPPDRPLPDVAAPEAGLPQVRLQPNPADDNVKINASGLTPGPCSVVTVDLEGRQIRSEPGKIGGDGRLLMSLNLEGLPSGYYIVRIESGERAGVSLPLLVVH